ncbi:MAG: radical SAM protein [Deltaproteobacteria bacterium]|nr:radical SAM protein [Deltaproteobacteria bacterium]
MKPIQDLKSTWSKWTGRSKGRDMSMGEPGFFKQIIRPKKLESVFLFVTSRCNSKCKTCFYASELNQGRDMTLEQIQTISRTAPKFDKLWLSGGEPFLRKDLVEIIEAFYKNNGIKSINLPTNGLLTEPVERMVGELLDRCPTLAIHLNFSVDGMPQTHDQVRGVKGGFAKTMATMKLMENKYHDHPRLHINAATVITPDAYDELYDLALYLLAEHKLSTHFFETVRGDPRDDSVKDLSLEDIKKLHRRIMPLYDVMADRLFEPLPAPARVLAKATFVGITRYLYQTHEENYQGPTPWSMPCTAGLTTVVIDHDGSYRACELRPKLGNLADYDFDLTAAMQAEAMQDEIEAIGGGERANCWCTHSCWILSSMKFSPATLLYEVPKAYWRARPQGSHVRIGPDVSRTLRDKYPELARMDQVAPASDREMSVKEAIQDSTS